MKKSNINLNTNKKLKMFEAFAGYGGASYSLKRSRIPIF